MFGSILQLLVSTLGLVGLGFDYQFKIYWKNKGFRKVLTLLPPRSIDQGMDYVVGIFETNIASRIKVPGTISAYDMASTLHMAPINLIGVAISTAVFPRMTERLSEGRPDLFRTELQSVIRVIIWLSLPVAVFTYYARGYIVNFIKSGGDPLMASILGALCIAILFRSIYFISARSFYAQQDTKTPLYISIFSIALNIVLASSWLLKLDAGATGARLGAVNYVSRWRLRYCSLSCRARIKNLFDAKFWNAIWRMVAASGGYGHYFSYGLVRLIPFTVNDGSFVDSFPKFCAHRAHDSSSPIHCLLELLLASRGEPSYSGLLKRLLFESYIYSERPELDD